MKGFSTKTAVGLWLALVVLGTWWVSVRGTASSRFRTGSAPVNAEVGPKIGNPTNLAAVLALEPVELTRVDIAVLNLLCGEGLADIGSLHRREALATLDAWSEQVKAETARHLYRFRRNPAEFERSEGLFRMVMLAVVLAEDYGVNYKPEGRMTPSDASAYDGFFANAADVFLAGLLGTKRQGACSSLPVLYVAVGRRLGYPLKLVTTKGHLFVRWEDARERFNVEATGEGVNRFEDAYYRAWPFPVTEEEVQAEGYLKSLSPAEELAVFLSIRGMCLREAGRRAEATESFAAASRLAPGCRGYRRMLASVTR